jgi:hypothetical protein
MNEIIALVPEMVSLSEAAASSAEIISHPKALPLMCYMKYYATVQNLPVIKKDWKRESVIESHIK